MEAGVYGCMDSTACNYDATATVSTGCSFACIGCLDSLALNYGGTGITIDDGSCIYPASNNDCSNAILITCGDQFTGSTVNATSS